MSEIQRLVDDAETPAEVREGLEKAAGVSEPYDVEAGLGRLKAVLAAGGVAAASGTAAAATSGGVGKAWLALTVVGALAGGGAIGLLAGEDPASEESERETVGSVEAPATVAEPRPTHAPSREEDAPSGVEAPIPDEREEAAPRRMAERVTTSESGAPGPATGALRSETLQLAGVRAALERSPAEALRLARDGQRRFPGGVFEEERLALIVVALDRSGQHARARRAAIDFIERYPDGPLTERVREISEGR